MNEKQIKLARHALGLPQPNKTSYRNRFYVSGGNVTDWLEMKSNGHADNVYEHYWLTPAGAALALLPGEKLDREDFPKGAK